MSFPSGIEPGYGPMYNWDRDDDEDMDDEMLQCEECHTFTESLLHGLCLACQVAQFEEESRQREAEIRRGK